MTVLYTDVLRQYLYQPQLSRQRNRYRGHRESAKTNLEMEQFLFDVTTLYGLLSSDADAFAAQATVLVDGGTVVEAHSVVGLEDLAGRTQALLTRVRALEQEA